MHRELAQGVIASVSPTASPETLAALVEAARLAARPRKQCIRCPRDFVPDEPQHNTCADCAYGLYLSQF